MKSKKIKKPYIKRSFIDIRNYKVLKSLKGDFNNNVKVKFNLMDGSVKILSVNNEFFKNKFNKPLNEAKILEKMNTLKHDFMADNYIISKY